MAVYVDRLRHVAQTRNYPFTTACHMYADTQVELYDMAEAIGLRERWFQDHRRLPHFDVTGTKRAMAVDEGAIQHTNTQMLEKSKEPEFRRRWNLVEATLTEIQAGPEGA